MNLPENYLELKELNKIDSEGLTELMRAVKSNDTDYAISLIGKGVDLEFKDSDGNNALKFAISNDLYDVVV